MGGSRIFNRSYSWGAGVIGLIFSAMGIVLLVRINQVGASAAVNLGCCVFFSVGTWIYWKVVAHVGIKSSGGSFVVQGFIRERTIPFREVASIGANDGLFLVLRDGRRVTVPGFAPSPYDEWRGYRRHHAASEVLDGHLRSSPSSSSGISSSIRMNSVSLILSLVFYFSVFGISAFIFNT